MLVINFFQGLKPVNGKSSFICKTKPFCEKIETTFKTESFFGKIERVSTPDFYTLIRFLCKL